MDLGNEELRVRVLFPSPGHVGQVDVRLKAMRMLRSMPQARRAAWEEELEEAKEDILGEGVVLSTTEHRGTYDKRYGEWHLPPGVHTGGSSVDDGIARVSVVEYALAGTVTTCEVTSYLNVRRLFHDVVVGAITLKETAESVAPITSDPVPKSPAGGRHPLDMLRPREELEAGVLFPPPGHVGQVEVRLKAKRVLRSMSPAHRAAWEGEWEEVRADILGEGVVLSTTKHRGTYDKKYDEWHVSLGANAALAPVDDGIAKVSLVEYVLAGTVTTCEVISHLSGGRLFHQVVVGEIEVKRVPEPAAPITTPRHPSSRQADDGWPSPSSPESLGHAGWFRMTPTEFEHAIAALCRRDGCTEVRTPGGAGDLGADVIARTPDGRKLVIQCKQYINKVGSPDVQKFAGTVFHHHRADVALLVTTSWLTAPAADYAHQVGIRTVDAERLDRWAKRVGPVPWR